MDMIEALICKMDMTEAPVEEEDVNHCKMDMIEALTENKAMVGLHVKIARASLGDIVLYRLLFVDTILSGKASRRPYSGMYSAFSM